MCNFCIGNVSHKQLIKLICLIEEGQKKFIVEINKIYKKILQQLHHSISVVHNKINKYLGLDSFMALHELAKMTLRESYKIKYMKFDSHVD